MINITYEKIYFNQYETISRLSMPDGEIRFLKFTLFKEDNRDLPEYGVCKIVNNNQDCGEAIIMRELSSKVMPGIIKYYSHYVSDKIYIYMESCRSKGSVFEYINNRSPSKSRFNEEYLLRQFNQLIQGINYINSSGYIHCDIATKNIFVTKSKDLKIADFGGTRKKGGYYRLYSRHYFPPYVLPKLKATMYFQVQPKYDFWALGKVLYECCMLQNQIDFNEDSSVIPQYVVPKSQKEINKRVKDDLESLYSDRVINLIFKLMNGTEFRNLHYDPLFEMKYKRENASSIGTSNTISYSLDLVFCSFCYGSGINVTKFTCFHGAHIECLLDPRNKIKVNLLCPFCHQYIGKDAASLIIPLLV